MRRGVWVAAAAALLIVPAAGAIGPFIEFQLRLIDHHDGPQTVDCVLSITPGWNMEDVLHNATVHFCINSWSANGGTVECINDLCSKNGWRLYLNDTAELRAFFTYHVYGNETVLFTFNDDGRDLPPLIVPTLPQTPDVPDVPPSVPTPPTP